MDKKLSWTGTTSQDANGGHSLGDPMVTMRDIAAFIGVNLRTVQEWRAEGLLPPPDFVAGKVLRWQRSTLERFVRSRAAERN